MNEKNHRVSSLLRPPWLNITRIAWILLSASAIVLSMLGILRSLGEPLPECTTGQAACAPWMVSQEDVALAQQSGVSEKLILAAYFVGMIFPKLAFAGVGLLIFWRRSQDWVAQLLSLMLMLFALEGVLNLGALKPLADVLYALSTIIFGVLPFIFPSGAFAPRWMGWVAVPNAILSSAAVFTPQLGLQADEDMYALLILIPFMVWFITSIYSVVYRYKYVSNAIEKQQTKWAIAGILGSFSLFIPFTVISIFFPPSEPSLERLSFVFLVHYPIYFISYLFIPGGVAFAILRYRLWDIDILIRRTLQYSLLTGLLAMIYFGGVVTLQGILSALTSNANTPIVTVLTTLGIAALFNPLRRRVQDFIDLRFYRKKYIAERALAAFATTARDEVDIHLLVSTLLAVVDETVQPETSVIWLRKR